MVTVGQVDRLLFAVWMEDAWSGYRRDGNDSSVVPVPGRVNIVAARVVLFPWTIVVRMAEMDWPCSETVVVKKPTSQHKQ